MPRRALNRTEIEMALLSRLKTLGPQSRAELQRALGVSQPTLSRLLKEQNERVVAVAQSGSPRYALKTSESWPIFEVDNAGKVQELGELIALEQHHFVMENMLFPDLPYFLSDMRPSGFLGRLVPEMHPELGLPRDLQTWNAKTTLKYLNSAGFNPPGNLLVGELAVQRFLRSEKEQICIPRSQYSAMVKDVLSVGVPGSSAAGEQPKFLATNDEGVHLLVKFSPPDQESVGERMSDILFCEHIAMTLLRQSGIAAAKTHVFRSTERTFLEVERFDRVGAKGRRGVLSLGTLVGEFIGEAASWSDASDKLVAQKKLLPAWRQRIRVLEIFGLLIANSDMHLYHLSFLSEHATFVVDLAPVYDMCPMSYAPRANQVVPVQFTPPVRRKIDQQAWEIALPLAVRFWKEVADDPNISAHFRMIAKENSEMLADL